MVHQAERRALRNRHLASERDTATVVKCAVGLAILAGLLLFGSPAEPNYTPGEQASVPTGINSMVAAAGTNRIGANASGPRQ